ncbi:RipA family octameric membrane protein [Streptomyces avermitilis]|uniref:RipA family octameric membrane protein n=1 Tax=Streptomyces avermitilis TaxID=33903 RepID=UPI0033EC7E92
MTEMRDALWNEAIGPTEYTDSSDRYRTALFEQYKLCVEMADRVSARRNASNTFFLTVNSALVTLLATALPELREGVSVWLLLPGLLILLSMCLSWFVLVRSYRQLNRVKWAVIGTFEERLPAYAYSRAEWHALGEGRDWRRYLQLSLIEQWVPLVFAVSYLLGFLVLAL